MSAQQNDLMLFGLDLRHLGRILAFAVRQLLFDPSSWVAARFQPPIWVLHGDCWYRCGAGKLTGAPLSALPEEAQFYGISVPEEEVLLKRIELPSSSEIFLSDAVSLEVQGCSPFSLDDLVFGHCVASRSDSSLEIVIAMTTHESIGTAQDRWRETKSAASDRSAAQVCAITDDQQLVEFNQYPDTARTSAYLGTLRVTALRFAAVMVLAVIILAVPAGSSAYRAGRLLDEFGHLRDQAKNVDQAVEALHMQRTVLTAVGEEVDNRLDYAFWLNHMAETTPDDTRLSRLLIDREAVQVLGYSDNAANYLRLLTEDPAYSAVTARSAFVRDSRSGKERFQIDWSLVSEVP